MITLQKKIREGRTNEMSGGCHVWVPTRAPLTFYYEHCSLLFTYVLCCMEITTFTGRKQIFHVQSHLAQLRPVVKKYMYGR
jgi:hypothetical protein